MKGGLRRRTLVKCVRLIKLLSLFLSSLLFDTFGECL